MTPRERVLRDALARLADFRVNGVRIGYGDGIAVPLAREALAAADAIPDAPAEQLLPCHKCSRVRSVSDRGGIWALCDECWGAIPDAPSMVEVPDGPEWDSVRKNAAETDTWPDWKRDGSGLQLGPRNAIPDAPVSGTVGPRALMTPAEEVAIEALQRIHDGATLPQFIANQALGRIEHVILLSAPRSPPDDAVVGHGYGDQCSVCGGAHVICNGLPAAPMTAERRSVLVAIASDGYRSVASFGVPECIDGILDALIKAGAVR